MGVLIETSHTKKKKTCPTKWSKRQILDGILYQLKNGCNWSDLPCIFTSLTPQYFGITNNGENKELLKILEMFGTAKSENYRKTDIK
ncbi:MAG: transposase [Trichodesmium sp. MO_231.B1]|nr:transposase [Trichodesmium sp. MO_231.B1]